VLHLKTVEIHYFDVSCDGCGLEYGAEDEDMNDTDVISDLLDDADWDWAPDHSLHLCPDCAVRFERVVMALAREQQ